MMKVIKLEKKKKSEDLETIVFKKLSDRTNMYKHCQNCGDIRSNDWVIFYMNAGTKTPLDWKVYGSYHITDGICPSCNKDLAKAYLSTN